VNTPSSNTLGCPRLIALAFVAIGGLASPLRAQCHRWTNELELPGVVPGPNSNELNAVRALERYDNGSGEVLVAGGNFISAGGVPAPGLAQWNGSVWTAMDPIAPSASAPFHVSSLLALGSDLLVGGRTPWNGAQPGQGFLSRLGAAPAVLGLFTQNDEPGDVRAVSMFNGDLYAAGVFKNAGGVPANRIARYTGSGWSALGTGLSGPVADLEVFDDGTGAQLFVVGEFNQAGGLLTYGAARWNGTSWSTAGVPFGHWSWSSLEVFDDGTGPGLYASLWHETSGNLVMKYAGTHWSTVGTADGLIHRIAALDDGTGRALYAAGQFKSMNGLAANGIARWDGRGWSALGAGLVPASSPGWPLTGARALETYDDGSGAGSVVHAGGLFTRADADSVDHFAAWKPCVFAGNSFCFGDGSLATACPCVPPTYFVPNPSGASDSGCANTRYFSGAKLIAIGTTSPDQAHLIGSALTLAGFTVFFAGNASGGDGFAYGHGVRCADGAIVRFGSQFPAWGSVNYPNLALGFDRPLSQASGVVPGSGQTRYYQAFYRDFVSGFSFCNSNGFNVTNAVAITW
jgi:hypothetical protein